MTTSVIVILAVLAVVWFFFKLALQVVVWLLVGAALLLGYAHYSGYLPLN